MRYCNVVLLARDTLLYKVLVLEYSFFPRQNTTSVVAIIFLVPRDTKMCHDTVLLLGKSKAFDTKKMLTQRYK